MKPYVHQLEGAAEIYKILAAHMLVYVAWEERTGKTLTSILVCERAKVQRILVLTKKKALAGWHETLEAFPHKKQYTVNNYHQAKKYKPEDFDLVILDEAHSYVSAFPKRSGMWKTVRLLTKGKPLIYMSATPHAQGMQLLYNPLALSDWSPFIKYSTPYSWFRRFGIPDAIYLASGPQETYKKCKTDEVRLYTKHLFSSRTRAELGFEHEPEDKVHYIELLPKVKEVYNILMKHKALELNGHELICDTSMKLRTSLHMLEGGVMKVGKQYVILGNTEKIDYIKEVWGDTDDIAIMYQYIAEGTKLRDSFSNAEILQATSFAEGVDLSHKRHLVIYSQDFSTARHSQRRARQANKKRDTPIAVHFLLVKKALSEQVYTTVSLNKTNFVDSVFTQERL